MKIEGVIISVEEFAINDGPGVRMTIFLKGCPIRCVWCHNPEGQRFGPEPIVRNGIEEICGIRIDSEDMAKRLLKNEKVLKMMEGGVTFTGGEPLSQGMFLIDVLERIKGHIHTSIETSGYAVPQVFHKVVKLTDFIQMDFKFANNELHRRFTGADNETIRENLAYLCASEKPFAIRIPLIPGINDTEDNAEKTAELLADAKNLQYVEFLRYNKLAGAKYAMLGREYNPPFDENAEPQVHAKPFEKLNIKTVVL